MKAVPAAELLARKVPLRVARLQAVRPEFIGARKLVARPHRSALPFSEVARLRFLMNPRIRAGWFSLPASNGAPRGRLRQGAALDPLRGLSPLRTPFCCRLSAGRHFRTRAHTKPLPHCVRGRGVFMGSWLAVRRYRLKALPQGRRAGAIKGGSNCLRMQSAGGGSHWALRDL